MKENLRKIRLTLGYNQQKMADELDIPLRTYMGYEYKAKVYPADFLLKLANILNVNLHFLYTGEGEMFIIQGTEQFEECNDTLILENFKNFHVRYTKMLAVLNTTDYEVAKRTGIPESRLEKIGLGDAVITMEEFIKLRAKYAFDANMLLFDKGFCSANTNINEEFSSDEIETLKKLAKKFT